MKQLSIMIKPASSLCNLRCKYCFYADIADLREVRSFGIMKPEMTEAILANIKEGLDTGDRITFAFQGGEPTIAGLDYFRHFTSIVDTWTGIDVHYALQTNATLLDDEWCVFLKKYNFLLGVSWDILPDCHDAARLDTTGKGTSKRVLDAIYLLNKHKVEYNVLCTLTNFVARHPNQVWKQIVKHDIQYIQFTPCLDELEATGESPYALNPKRFASFYDQIFDLWYADFKAGKYRSVKLIDDIVNLLAFGVPSACGINGRCTPQIVVESNGSVYPCDFYCVDEYILGNLSEQPLKEIFESPVNRAFAGRAHQRPKLCATCEFSRFCGGNCKRMQKQICCGPEDTFCGYQNFLRTHAKDFEQIALQERRFRQGGAF